MRRVLGFFDWRFLVAFTGLLLAGALIQSSLAAAADRDRAIAQGAAERKQASIERDRLLDGQRDLEAKYDRLIQWLNSQDIEVPDQVLTGRPSITIRNSSSGGDDDSSDDNNDSDSQSTPRAPAPTVRPTATTTPPNLLDPADRIVERLEDIVPLPTPSSNASDDNDSGLLGDLISKD